MGTYTFYGGNVATGIPCNGSTLTNYGPATVYYGDSQRTTPSSYQGALPSGGSVALDGVQFLVVGAARATVAVSDPPVPSIASPPSVTAPSIVAFQPFGEPATAGVTPSLKAWSPCTQITAASLRVRGAPSGGPVTAAIRHNGNVVTTLTIPDGSTTEQVATDISMLAQNDLLDVNFSTVNGATGIILQLTLSETTAPASPTTIGAVIDYWDGADLGADTSSISSWTGRKSARVLAQATGASQPSVVANAINAIKAATFDGTNDYMSYAPGTRFVTTTDVELFAVLSRTGGTGNPMAVSIDDGTSSDWDNNASAELAVYFGATQQIGAYRNGNGGLISWPSARTSFGLVHSFWSGTSHTIEEGGSSASATIGSGSFNANRLNVGAIAGGGSSFWGGQFAAIVLANGLTPTERLTIKNYLALRFAL